MRLDGLTGLIVDDHAHMRRVLRAILGSLGVRETFEAEDAADAFDCLQSKPLDFALVDYSMPQLDGVEFIRLVRRSPDMPNNILPIVVCTAYSTLSVIRRCLDAGADEVLTKPVSARQIQHKVYAAVFHRRPIIESGSYRGPDRREIKEDLYRRRTPLTKPQSPQERAAAQERRAAPVAAPVAAATAPAAPAEPVDESWFDTQPWFK